MRLTSDVSATLMGDTVRLDLAQSADLRIRPGARPPAAGGTGRGATPGREASRRDDRGGGAVIVFLTGLWLEEAGLLLGQPYDIEVGRRELVLGTV